jgi:hypothetical protein
MPQDAIAFGAESLDCFLRSEVEVVGAKADDGAAEGVEGVR